MSWMSLSCATNRLRTVQCSISCSSTPNCFRLMASGSFSQIRQILSSDPEARKRPSGENFREVTTPLCLDMEQRGRRSDLSGRSQVSIVVVVELVVVDDGAGGDFLDFGLVVVCSNVDSWKN